MNKSELYLEKLDVGVPVYHSSEKEGKEPVTVPLVLSEYSINFTDYRDGIGGYLKTEFADNDHDNRVITGWVDSGNVQKVGSLKRLLVRFGATKILD